MPEMPINNEPMPVSYPATDFLIRGRGIIDETQAILERQFADVMEEHFMMDSNTLGQTVTDSIPVQDSQWAYIEAPVLASMPILHKWPIGTIVKWDISQKIIANYINNNNRQEQLLIQILDYTSGGNIWRYRYINEVEDEDNSIECRYFKLATAEECIEYERVRASLKQCETMPPIGTVLEYLGNMRNKELKGKRGVVLSHVSNNRILFHWFNEVRNDENIRFDRFKISDSQRNGFTPPPLDICECKNCNSSRILSYSIHIHLGDTDIMHFCDDHCAISSGYFKCGCCGTWMNTRNEQSCTYINDVFICTFCAQTEYASCACCARQELRRRMHLNMDLSFTCRYCHENSTKLIHDHSFKPFFSFQKMVWENTRYLGIELEIEVKDSGDTRDKLARLIKTWLGQQPPVPDFKGRDGKIVKGRSLDKLVYFKFDRSLNNGIEIVFHPFTLKSFHKHFPLQGFLKLLADNKGYIAGNCGMHIHVSKERLSSMDLTRGRWFFYHCEPFLKRFSEREKFDYCKFEKFRPPTDPYYQEFGHYSCLNIANPSCKTMEVRLFNATLDHKKFLANLQFSDLFVDYIQNGPGIAFLKRQSKYVIWQNFIDYAKAQNRYQIFTNWILTRAIV